jgi:hypothetical protein
MGDHPPCIPLKPAGSSKVNDGSAQRLKGGNLPHIGILLQCQLETDNSAGTAASRSRGRIARERSNRHPGAVVVPLLT